MMSITWKNLNRLGMLSSFYQIEESEMVQVIQGKFGAVDRLLAWSSWEIEIWSILPFTILRT